MVVFDRIIALKFALYFDSLALKFSSLLRFEVKTFCTEVKKFLGLHISSKTPTPKPQL